MAPVVFVMIDGLRPDAIDRCDCPQLRAFRARGASTMAARSVTPSMTLPCHTSIFHSVPPSRHGITSNTWTPMARPLPGLLDLARADNLRCAMFYNWEPLRDLGRPGSLFRSAFRDTAYEPDGDAWVASEASQALADGGLDFAFVYLGTVDTAGHAYGWMSEGYLRQVEQADAWLGQVLDALPGDAHVLVQSDHGGIERNHGGDTPEELTIPWMVAGPRIRVDHTIESPVSLLDTAPTLAKLLALPRHREWEGRVVEEAIANSR